MKIFLASLEHKAHIPEIEFVLNKYAGKIYVLASYFYVVQRNNAKKDYSKFLPLYKDFMLDSGAFSVMVSGVRVPDWYEYIEKYAEWVKRNNVQKFLELDIDSVVGYEEVKKLRAMLEKLAGRQCIPVWHRPRGEIEFLRLCDEYSYIALGGVALKYIRNNEYKYLPYLINEAHKRNCLIHALGFTGLKNLSQYHFDSVDSSSWSMGARCGNVFTYCNGELSMSRKPEGHRIKNYKALDAHNLEQWIKFQQFADRRF